MIYVLAVAEKNIKIVMVEMHKKDCGLVFARPQCVFFRK